MIIRAYPKVNICLKITGFLNNYCEIASRFVKVENANLYDTIEIRQSDSFKISGNFDCKMSENTIFRAKEALREFLEDSSLQGDSCESPKQSIDSSLRGVKNAEAIQMLDFFHIAVDKKIPPFSGLGGGSSNAASYLIAMNEILELNLTPKDLVQIASRVGADVSFFVLGFSSANVFGIGEGVEFFSENAPKLEFFIPPIQCSTKAVYDEYRAMIARGEAHFYKNAKELLASDSTTLLQKNIINFLNDLYTPACKIYPQLADFAKDGYFFSGSGSTFFRLRH